MSNNVHQALGELTRQLHDALNGLGLLSSVQQLAGQIPDARDRLSYIANVTGNATFKKHARSYELGLKQIQEKISPPT